MKTLPDEIVAALPALMELYPGGPLAAQVAAFLAADAPNTRKAFEALQEAGKAKIVRRGRALHIVPPDYPGLICPVCRAEYERPPKSKRISCSRSCGVKWSWMQPVARERRTAGLQAAKRTPEASRKATEVNNKRWARPGEREKMSDFNRKRWADPYMNAKMAVGIQKANSTPEKRELQRQRIKARWDDEAGRAKLVAGIKLSKNTPEARAKFSKLLADRWADPAMRAKYVAKNGARARLLAERLKGKKQSPEQIAKRVESFKRTMAAKRSKEIV